MWKGPEKPLELQVGKLGVWGEVGVGGGLRRLGAGPGSELKKAAKTGRMHGQDGLSGGSEG